MDDKTSSEKPSNQPKITQEINVKAWTRAWFVQLQILNWLQYSTGPWVAD